MSLRIARFALACAILFSCAVAHAADAPSGDAAVSSGFSPRQRIEVHRNGASGDEVNVSVGIPFPAGALTDAGNVRILDPNGVEVPAHVDALLRWHFKDGSIRAVRAEFRAKLDKDIGTYYFATGPRMHDAPGFAYADTLVDGEGGMRVPGALATLTPEWLSASGIAGPQAPAVPPAAYDKYVDAQFQWARALPTKEASAWLFDRTSTLFKIYVRTGRFDVLQAAVSSYRFYMSHLKRTGIPLFDACGGGWLFTDSPCDVKYVYIEPILLAVGLVGDDSQHDAALVRLMSDLWDGGGWSGISGAYTKPDQNFTERQIGLGLLAIVSAYELTGDKHYRDDIAQRVGWLHDHQTKNPDGLPADGSWRHSWQKHENEAYDAATDVRGASPWMSENIVDGLWHAWLATGDDRIPPMLTAFGRYLERYGWIDPKLLTGRGKDWRHICSGPDGQIAWYWSSSIATQDQLAHIEEKDGWYSDEHTVELGLPVAVARYFETDPEQAKALERRLALIANSYATSCAEASSTHRRFNWNNRGAGVVQWLVKNFPAVSGSGHATAPAKQP